MSGNDCIFCRIAHGEISCAKVYEDAKVLAFLDLSPVREGHTLVISKAHHSNLLDTPDEDVTAILAVVRKVGKALMNATGAEGFNVLQNNFFAAGQQVFHAHWHVIPRGAEDGLSLWPQGAYSDSQAMLAMAERIAARMEP